MARLHAQRWVYRLGNSTLIVDNGFTWFGWGQERMLVNEGTVKQVAGWLALSRSFSEAWLSPNGEGEVVVQLMSGLASLVCEIRLNGERLEPEACYSASWLGERGHWPDDIPWEERPLRHAISFTKQKLQT